jgi:hypothetical protein
VQLHLAFAFGFADGCADGLLSAGGITALVSGEIAAVAIPLNDADDTAGDDVTFALRAAITTNPPRPAHTNTIAKSASDDFCSELGRKFGSNGLCWVGRCCSTLASSAFSR